MATFTLRRSAAFGLALALLLPLGACSTNEQIQEAIEDAREREERESDRRAGQGALDEMDRHQD